MTAWRGGYEPDDSFGMSVGELPGASNTYRLIQSELTSEPDPNAARDIEWRAGEVLLREFEVDRQLGAGGFGTVMLVRSALTHCRYAMKTLRPELLARPRSRRAFGVELAMWIDLGAHPHVVRASFVRQIGTATAVFMEYVTGGTLAEWIEQGLVVELPTIARIAGEIAAGLDFAHARGLVHADVKPENVLMSATGAKVSDFGLAVAAGAGAAGMTIVYRSPEQAAGAFLTPATDVWSFGLIVLAMFAGGPFWADGQVAEAALQDLVDDPLPNRPPLSETVQSALRCCFAPRPEDRWPSVTAAARAVFGSVGLPAVALHAPAGSANAALQVPAAPPEETEKERRIERWLLRAFELAGRDASEARERFPPRCASREAQALADLDAFDVAAPLLAQYAGPEDLAEVHAHWGDAFWDIGDFAAAMEHAEKRVAALKRADASDPFSLAAALRCMAFVALRCRRHMEAGRPLNEALQLLGALGEDGAAEGPATILVPELGRPLLHELGLTYTDAAQWARLTLHFDGARACASLAVKACALAASAGPADASLLYDLARAHSEEATALKWLNQSAAAVESFRTAFHFFRESKHSESVSEMRLTLSNALRDLGRFEEAMAEIQTAIAEFTAHARSSATPKGDGLSMAYRVRAELLVRREDWYGALPDFEHVRWHLEQLACVEGQRQNYRLLAEAQLHHAQALQRVGRYDESRAIIEHTIPFLERLRDAGDWGHLSEELYKAHQLASGNELDRVIREVSTTSRGSGGHVAAAAAHVAAAAEYADEHSRAKPDPEWVFRTAELAFSAVNMFSLIGAFEQVRPNLARAREALDALDAMPENPWTPKATSLRGNLTQWEHDADLSLALAALLKGDGEGAVAHASRWNDAWVSKCIQFTAYSFFFYEEPLKTAEVFGGIDAMQLLSQSDRIEPHFLRGIGALLRGKPAAAIASFRAAVEFARSDPFVLFGFAYACSLCGAPQKEVEAAYARFSERAHSQHPNHPLLRTAELMLQWPHPVGSRRNEGSPAVIPPATQP